MKKIYSKMLAITLALILSTTMIVTTSYAWFALSKSPAVNGIQVAIGGGNTILVAADLTETADGKVYHYPDRFSDKLNFGAHKSYEYLNSLGGLTPVSTADGVHWYLPAYYHTGDQEVRSGAALSGQLRDVADFKEDSGLEHANLPAGKKNKISEGNYIYLDFWVVSPGNDYKLHISTGDDSSGSFVMDLPRAEETAAGTGGFFLVPPEKNGSAAVRVGFLVNPDPVTDSTMEYYQNSDSFDERYTVLRGGYQDKDQNWVCMDNVRFTIYEPNGDYHPAAAEQNGRYIPTLPVAEVNGVPAAVRKMDGLTVQKTSIWKTAPETAETEIGQIFQAAVCTPGLEGKSPEEVTEWFYKEYLQGQFSSHVIKGSFIKRASDLAAFRGASISPEEFGGLDSAGAADDVYLTELSHNVPQRIRMFIWLEGQDADCTNEVSGSAFSVNVELAGSSK